MHEFIVLPTPEDFLEFETGSELFRFDKLVFDTEDEANAFFDGFNIAHNSEIFEVISHDSNIVSFTCDDVTQVLELKNSEMAGSFVLGTQSRALYPNPVFYDASHPKFETLKSIIKDDKSNSAP